MYEIEFYFRNYVVKAFPVDIFQNFWGIFLRSGENSTHKTCQLQIRYVKSHVAV